MTLVIFAPFSQGCFGDESDFARDAEHFGFCVATFYEDLDLEDVYAHVH